MATFTKKLSNDNRYSITLVVNEQSTSISNNTSTISYTLTATKSSGGGYWTASKTNPVKVKINGNTLVDKNVAYDFRDSTPQTITLATGTTTIQHEVDGTKTISCSGYFKDNSNSLGSATASGSLKLTDIPRLSYARLSNDNVDLGTEITIYIEKVNNEYTHTLSYIFGNATGTIGTNISDSTTWTPSLNLANQIPSSTSSGGIIKCETYLGNELIGYVNTLITLNVPSSIIPNVVFTDISEAGDVPSSWVSNGNHVYVKTKSKVALTLFGNSYYGATISSYKISYYGGELLTNTLTTNFITTSGNITFTGQATDTRNRTNNITNTINVVDYNPPTLSVFEIQRCDTNGNIDNNGNYCLITYTGSISSCLNQNTPNAVYKIGYKIQGTENYTYITLATNTNSYSESGMLYTDGIYPANRGSGTKLQLPATNTYDIEFFVKDYFSETKNYQTIDTGFDLLNFNPSGKSMAIGKVSEALPNEELLEVALKTKFYEKVEAEDVDANDINANDISSTSMSTTLFNATTGNFDGITVNNADPYQTTTGNLTISKTSGNSTCTGTYYKYGKIVMVNVAISTTGTTNAGSNIFEGTIDNITPAINTMLSGYVGNRAILGGFGADNKFVIRNASTSNISSGSTINIRGTFIVE